MADGIHKREFLKRGACLAFAGAGAAFLPAAPARAAAAPARNNRIARVSASIVSVQGEYAIGTYTRNARMGGVVAEVETEDGLTGHGFAAIADSTIVAATIRESIAGRLMGQDAMSHEAIVEQLYWALTDRGQTGNAIQAISAVDCALWDLKGKRYGEPVWRLLGGANREVGGYATCGMNYMSRDELTYVASELVKSGCNRLKMVVADGLPGRLRNEDIEAVLAEDAARVRALREGAGPEALIFIDANHHLDEWHAIRFARMIADYDVAIFEEPLRANDIRRLADLRREIAIPIGAGQNEGHISRWRDMVVNDAVDVLHYNVCIGGGYTTGLKVAALGQAFGVPIDNGGGFSHFNVQLHGGVANGGLCEWHMNVVPFSRILYNGIPELQGNKFILSETPGVGFELNREALQEFTVG